MHVLPKTTGEKCFPDISRAYLYKNLIMKIERESADISRQDKTRWIARAAAAAAIGFSPWMMFHVRWKRCMRAQMQFLPPLISSFCFNRRGIAFIGYRCPESICYEDLLRPAAQVRASRGVTRRQVGRNEDLSRSCWKENTSRHV